MWECGKHQCQAHARDDFRTDGGVFVEGLVLSTRCLYTKKKAVHIHLHRMRFPPVYLIVFCIWLRSDSACALKKRFGLFHYEEQVSPVRRDESPSMPVWSIKSGRVSRIPILWWRLTDIEPSAFYQRVLSSECSILCSCLAASEGGKGPSRKLGFVPHSHTGTRIYVSAKTTVPNPYA